MTNSRRILLLAGSAIVILLIPLAYLVISVAQSRRDLQKYLGTLEKQGESLDIAALAPPPPPTNDNGAPDFLAAAKELKTLRLSQTGNYIIPTQEQTPGIFVVLQRAPDSATGRRSLSWKEAAEKLEPSAPVLARIRDATRAPVFEIQPDFTAPLPARITGDAEAIMSARVLWEQGTMFLRAGNASGALENNLTVLHLAGMTEKQPGLLSRLVTTVLLDLAQAQTWELLQSPDLSEEMLAGLQNAWERVDVLSTFPLVMRLDRAIEIPQYSTAGFEIFQSALEFRALTRRSTTFEFSKPTAAESLNAYHQYLLWSRFYRHIDARQLAEAYQALIDHSPPSTATWSSALAKGKQLQSAMAGTGLKHNFSRAQIDGLCENIARIIGTQTMARLTFTAIALQRYKLARKEYPTSLSALVPDFLSSVPVDSLDGSSIHYRLLPDGSVLLYANGIDGKDDGGDATAPAIKRPKLFERKDIVWPRPAP